MRPSALAPAPLLAMLLACGPEAPVVLDGEAACPITAPIRLVAAPEGFAPEEDAWYGLHGFGDDILFTFDRFDDPARVYWRLDRCTGEVEEYPALAPGFHHPYVIEAAAGRVLYGNDEAGRPHLLDRLDVAGSDAPVAVPGLPEDIVFYPFTPPGARYALFQLLWASFGSGEGIHDVAGLGGVLGGFYTHSGDPAAPAVKISDTRVSIFRLGDTELLLHEDSGEVLRVDALTGERELLVAGARHVDYGFDERTFIWQAIGDDVAEPVYLHTLESGGDVQIAVNDFAAISWGRDPESSNNGEWTHTRDATAAAMVGPGDRYVAAVRLDTGAAVEIPPHRAGRGSFAGAFVIALDDPDDEVLALWDPLVGAVRTWYRGPAKEAYVVALDGDRLDYFAREFDGPDLGSLWRVDLESGETTELIAGVSRFPTPVDGGRYFTSIVRAYLDGPRISNSIQLVPVVRDLAVWDVERGEETRIVDGIAGYSIVPDEGLLYLDAHGDEPGVWAYPLTFASE